MTSGQKSGGCGKSAAVFICDGRTFAGSLFRRTIFRGAFFRRTLLGCAFLGRTFFGAIRLGLVVFLVLRISAASGRRGLLGVVGDVPAGALELHSGGGDHLLDLAAALGAGLDHLVRELLDFFEAVAALLAFVFVKRHECETVVRNKLGFILILGARRGGVNSGP